MFNTFLFLQLTYVNFIHIFNFGLFAGQLQQSISMLEIHEPSSSKILKSHHSLNRSTQPFTGRNITNTYTAKGKENNSTLSKSPKSKLNYIITLF